MQIDGLNPKGLARSLTGSSEMNELLSPAPFSSDLSSAVGLFSCQAAPVHPATCIHFLTSPGMVAILILFVKVQKRLGVPEGFLLYPRL